MTKAPKLEKEENNPQPIRPIICNDGGSCYTNGQEIPSTTPSLPHFQDYSYDDWQMPLDQAPSMFEAFSTIGDIAEGGFFVFLSIYAGIASCVYGGLACIVTLPIFYTMTVFFGQHMWNGIQSYRQRFDPLIEPTGREIIDIFLPFLKKD